MSSWNISYSVESLEWSIKLFYNLGARPFWVEYKQRTGNYIQFCMFISVGSFFIIYLLSADLFFNINCFIKFFLFHQWVKQFGFRSGPGVIKLFPCSTQLGTKIILLINVKMPTIVGILTFMSMINTKSERLKARYFFIYRYFSFYLCSVKLTWKKIVGILTFMSMINTKSERLKARYFFIYRYFSFYLCSVKLTWKKFFNLSARPDIFLVLIWVQTFSKEYQLRRKFGSGRQIIIKPFIFYSWPLVKSA